MHHPVRPRQAAAPFVRTAGLMCAVVAWALIAVAPGRAAASEPEGLRDAIDGMVARARAAGAVPSAGRVAIVTLPMRDLDARGRGKLGDLVAARLMAAGFAEIEPETGLARRLEDVYMDPKDMYDTARRRAFYATPRSAGIDWFVVIGGAALSTVLHVQLDFESVHSTRSIITASGDATMDRSLLEFLGRPVPRTFAVHAPDGTVISVDGSTVGTVMGSPLRIPLTPGSHAVVANLPGYATHFSSLEMPGARDLAMELKKRNCTGAPLYATLYGAILPGLSIAMYGSPELPDGSYKHGSTTVAYMGSALFYGALATWAIDKAAAEDPLTLESQDRRDKIQKIELGAALVGYAVNLIGSYALGVDFARDNRSLVRSQLTLTDEQASNSGTSATFGLALAAGAGGPAPVLGLSGRF